MNCNIQNYIDFVRSGKIEVCKEQIQLCNYVEECFREEDIWVDEQQLETYLSYQKYFPFKLLDWEKFCFALHNCVYKRNGQPRWSILFAMMGRGSGKNGYIAFEDFCLLTPTNGIKNYDIDIFATAEDQAKRSFEDVWEVLEDNKEKMKSHFNWNKECITNLKTRSKLRFRTGGAKTKDGGRPGKVDFDEYHAYEDNKLIDVAITGLGKKRHPRRTIITTDGYVREGPLDALKEKAENILNGKVEDNGMLPFICRLDSDKEIEDKNKWEKAIPSLPFFPDLLHEIEIEFGGYLENKLGNSSFATKRMNRPQGDKEQEVTTWDNIMATKQPLIDLTGRCCVAGIDYAMTTDFVAVGLLFIVDGFHYWITHTWVCRDCKDLSRIKFPLEEAQARGELEFVDDVEIHPSIPAKWLKEMKKIYRILKVGIDDYRYTLLSKYLRDAGFDGENKDKNKRTVVKVRPSNEMMIAPTITRLFTNHLYRWGDNKLMRWYTNNTKMAMSPAGNITYGKIEPKSRKIDGFKALVAAETIGEILEKYQTKNNIPNLGVWTY